MSANASTPGSAPASPPRNRRWRVAAGVLLALAALAVAATHVATRQLHAVVIEALGPRASLESLSIGWRGVELRGLVITAAARGWPAREELRAERVRVLPSWRSLVGRGWHVAKVEVTGGYLSMQRTRDGRLRVLPALLESRRDDAPAARGDAAAEPAAVHVHSVVLTGTTVDFHDASLARGPHRLRLERLDAQVDGLVLPALDQPLDVELSATLKGARHDGSLSVKGTLTPATRDAKLAARARGIDLVVLQPYLLKVAESGVRSGRLDLTLDANVKSQRLSAPGVVTLTDLELGGGDGVLGTIAGVPRQAVLAAMKRNGRIEVRFTLEGRLDDPSFSVNDHFAMRLASGLAEVLGVSVGGVVEGVGNVIKGLFGR